MPAIIHRILIAATLGKVFRSIAEPQHLSHWWTSKVISNTNKLQFHFEENYYKEMEIISQKADSGVVWECLAGADEWIGTSITFKPERFDLYSNPEMRGQWEQLTDHSEVTLLHFCHSDWKDETPMFAECNYTWALFLRSLKSYCETGKGTPWPERR